MLLHSPISPSTQTTPELSLLFQSPQPNPKRSFDLIFEFSSQSTMQLSSSVETNSNSSDIAEKPKSPKMSNSPAAAENKKQSDGAMNDEKNVEEEEDELVLDVTGRNFESDMLEKAEEGVEGLYLYKNSFSLVPKSVGRLGRLKTLKFFGNKVNLFPTELGNLVGLERLQVKISPPGLNGWGLNKLNGLKELELSKAPIRPSVLTILSEISGIKCLTKLSVCHFSIRYLPSEIGCLNKLEYLDLSFNKIKILPVEVCYLSALISLKVANNKLVEIPSGLTSLQRLENLDLSRNRLTSLGSLDLGRMRNLQYLHLQNNKLLSCCQIPSWICCNLEGNGKDLSNDDFISSSVEMDVYESSIQDDGKSYKGSHYSSQLSSSSSNSRCFAARKSSKRWKRRHYLQQKARLERLNTSRKWKAEGHGDLLRLKKSETRKPDDLNVITSETLTEGASDVTQLDNDKDKEALSRVAKVKNALINVDDDNINSKAAGVCKENSLANLDCRNKGRGDDFCVHDDFSSTTANEVGKQDEWSSSEISRNGSKSKRHCDVDLDNPKPCKCRRAMENSRGLSRKYSDISFCSTEDYLPDGFYDAGRHRPFMPLKSYEPIFDLDSREVILLDREKDEELDAVALSAQALVKRLIGDANKNIANNLQIASFLALFVSDHFGGSDRYATVERTRKAVSGSNYRKPFVCTCSTGNNNSVSTSTKQILSAEGDVILSDLCEKSLCSIKSRRNSIVVPIGTLQFGICRHRALLMKYLCDRMDPPIPCELVRGYLDFVPHAWNIVLIKRGDSFVRMLVDACRPRDIREEMDPEYFCRYIPLSRTTVPLSTEIIPGAGCSFPSFSTCDEIETKNASRLVCCRFGPVEAAAKIRTLDVSGMPADEIKNFEYSCLGEVRILGALRHPCIVGMYGHQISSKWISSEDGNSQRRVLQSAILMEYVKGGSLKSYIEKLSKSGERHVPIDLTLCIARDIASALAELHAKHIIHRDIKSENVLIDQNSGKTDGMLVVKLCDFDRAVPLRSHLHTCCIAHRGVAPPDVCVGTPRWMAPEVFRAMHKREIYGLEVDIWSYGCLLLELLTLQVPYSGLPELHIHELLQMGKRPQLGNELEALLPRNDPKASLAGSGEGSEESATLRFLVGLYHQCTEKNPADRPKAADIYQLLVEHMSNLNSSRS